MERTRDPGDVADGSRRHRRGQEVGEADQVQAELPSIRSRLELPGPLDGVLQGGDAYNRIGP
jgi:hypothetical protein